MIIDALHTTVMFVQLIWIGIGIIFIKTYKMDDVGWMLILGAAFMSIIHIMLGEI